MNKIFGVLEFWDSARGFGFVRVVDSKGYVSRWFLHVTKIISGAPKPGAGVVFVTDCQSSEREKTAKHAVAIEAEIGEVIPKFAKQSGGAR